MYIKKKKKRGQSTVEYVLLVTAVVVVIIAFVSAKNSGFQTQLNTALNEVTQEMNTEAGVLAASYVAGQPPTATAVTPPYTVNVEKGL